MPENLKALTELLLERGLKVATAESCTAGLLAKLLTDAPGSSQWFERGFVTYSNAAKQEMLGVAGTTLANHGAVSEQAVIEMARGAVEQSHASVALAISGIAGPDGGTPGKPVGTVWFAWLLAGAEAAREVILFQGSRDAIRQQAAAHAVQGLLKYLRNL